MTHMQAPPQMGNKRKKSPQVTAFKAEVCSSLCHSSRNSGHQRETNNSWAGAVPRSRAGLSAASQRHLAAGGRRSEACSLPGCPGLRTPTPHLPAQRRRAGRVCPTAVPPSPAGNGLDMSTSPIPFSLSVPASSFNILQLRHSRLPEGLEN